MLKKENRVDKHLFSDIIKKGISHYSKNVSFKVIKTTSNKARLSVYVPKKEIKSAVKRNLLKRRARSVLQKILTKINSQYGLVILLKKEAIDLPYQELEDEIIFLFKKAKIV